MSTQVMSILIALSVVAIGVAILVGHPLTAKLLTIAAVIAAGAVAVTLILT